MKNNLILIKWRYHGWLRGPLEDYEVDRPMYDWCMNQPWTFAVKFEGFPYPDIKDEHEYSGELIHCRTNTDTEIIDNEMFFDSIIKMTQESGWRDLLDVSTFSTFLGWYFEPNEKDYNHVELWRCWQPKVFNTLKKLSCVF